MKTFIDGSWIAPSGESLASIDPSNGDVIDTIPACDSAVVDSAVQAAAQAFPSWMHTPVESRVALLKEFASRLRKEYGEPGEATELKLLIRQETGKMLPEADIEVVESADMIEYFADNAAALLSLEEPAIDTGLWPTKRARVELQPLGPVAIIKAWNYPLEIPIWAIAPALVSGNTVVFKPSEHSSLVGLTIARLIEAAGFPPGVFNVVTGDGRTGEALATHNKIRLISFTGSVKTGRTLGRLAGERLVGFNSELGGNDAAIVLPDADLELTANGLVWGAVCNSGQVCVGVKRILARSEIYDQLSEMLASRIGALRKDIDFGPLISKQQLDVVKSYVEDACSKGARLAAQAECPPSKGFYFPPTLLIDVSGSAHLAQEECFGPILPVFRVDSHAEAIAMANETSYGLGASVWTSSAPSFLRVAEQLDCGMVWENDVNVALPQAPWSGRKDSGDGIDLSRWGLWEYVRPKHYLRELGSDKRRDWWYPY